ANTIASLPLVNLRKESKITVAKMIADPGTEPASETGVEHAHGRQQHQPLVGGRILAHQQAGRGHAAEQHHVGHRRDHEVQFRMASLEMLARLLEVMESRSRPLRNTAWRVFSNRFVAN